MRGQATNQQTNQMFHLLSNQREPFTDMITNLFGKLPDGIDIAPAPLTDPEGEYVKLSGVANDRLILYFHGGGYGPLLPGAFTIILRGQNNASGDLRLHSVKYWQSMTVRCT